jgi:SAM-dependent methyltransferase
MAKVTPITCCRLCGGRDIRAVLSLRPTPVGDTYLPRDQHPERLECHELDLFLCADCGHCQLGALVDPEEIYSDYLYTTSVSPGLADHFKSYAETVCRKLELAEGSLVIDIGSNDGTLLRAFKARGMRVLGVDPAEAIAKKATASGIPTINAFFDPALAGQIRLQHGGAALVMANNVMANVPDPESFVRGIGLLLGERGHFVWETGYVRYLTEDCVFDNIHHEHIDYYAVRPLVPFYERLGLTLYDVEVTASKGSSLRCFVTRSASHPKVLPSVKALIEREESRGYYTPEPYTRLAKKLEATREKLKELLSGWRSEGKTVAGYGAAIGSTTVLYHLELGPFIDALIDDNPIRDGLRSPGLGIPAMSAARLNGPDRPDYTVILAWRYADAIIRRNQAYLDRGGAFVTVLPEVRVQSGLLACGS